MSYSLVVEKDVSIPLRDGETVVADVFRPAEAGTFPVIITLGPYPKKLEPGAIVALEVEIWPTSVVVERGERLVLELGAKDDPRSFFQHDDPRDRARTGTNTIHTGGKFDSHLLLPIIPARWP